jgi:hypothetical protein
MVLQAVAAVLSFTNSRITVTVAVTATAHGVI